MPALTFRCLAPAVLMAGLAAPMPALPGDVTVVDASAQMVEDLGDRGLWRFTVTLEHADTGWEHYADRFDILDPSGAVLGVRTLFHPHVNEQPFTRSLDRVEVPHSVTSVFVRGNDSQHGESPVLLELELTR